MDKRKRARLEQAGWAIGSAKDFLSLSDAEAALIDLKLDLSRWHRERRKKIGISQTALAKRLHSSQSRVAKIESGDPSVSIDLVIRSLLVLRAQPKDLARMVQTGRR